VITGTIYRHSDGRERRDFDGRETVLLHPDSASMITLDPSTKKGDRLVLNVPGKPGMMAISWSLKGLGPNILDLRGESYGDAFFHEETIHGLRCSRYLKEAKPSNVRTTLWIATDLQILVKLHSVNPAESYDWFLTGVELREPDPELWIVPQDYEMSDYLEAD